ncbi:MAG TPA: DNA primase [Thermomicrobiales bacterium]|jgi:DNA primase
MAERNDITEIRERIDMLELVGAKVQLKRSGKNWKGLCPFHTEKTPSFYVYPDSGNYVCFSCGEKGDAFTWLQKTEGMDFPDALEQLAARVGVTLQRGTVRDPGRDEERERIFAVNEEAATFFASVLLSSPVGEAGRRYVAERGLTRETVERFALGFAPDSWDALLKHLVSHGHREELLAEAGLLTERDDGRRYDRFRGRLMFPIRNRDSRIVGFGGRALGDARPKYLNTAQTTVFDKSANLYAIDLAKEAIRKSDTAVIVEGYVDAIMAHQVGHANVVASMGTALTEAQVGLLKRLTARIVLALDSDAAGQAAMLRGIETMRGALDYDEKAVVDPRQMIRFERKLSTEILVLTLPEGKDPDEFLRARPGEWPALVGGAEPLLDFVMRAVVGGIDLSDPKAKSAAVGQLAPLIRELPDSIQQAHYVGLLARMLHLGEEVVASEIRRLALVRPTRGGTNGGPTPTEPAAIERRGPSREDHLLTLLLTHPDAAHELAAEIEPEDFTDAADRAVWTATRPTIIADPRLQTADLLTAIGDPALRESAEKLITIPSTRPTAVPGPVRQEIRNTLKLLRQEANKAQIQRLQSAIGEAAQEGDVEAVRALMEQLPVLYERLRTFDPPMSPYFRDTRTVADKR